jgi:hypothetical protein
MSFWESVLGGGAGAYGYKELMDRMQEQRGDVMGSIGDITQQVQNQGGFTPWGVRAGGLGSGSYDPATGQMDYQLNEGQRQQQSYYGGAAQDMYQKAMQMNPRYGQQATFYNDAARQAANRSMQDPTQREGDIYNRMREMQRPGEERQRDQMTSNLFGSGRGGMSSGAYGASPEEYGFNMARNEAMNQASYQAMGQAQQEMQNYQNMGQSLYGMGQQNQAMYGQLAGQMGAAQYDPYNMLLQQNQQGMAGGQLMNQSGQAMAGLLAQLGLGSATTDVNLQQVDASAFSGLMEMLGLAASGAGSAIDDIIAS